MLIILTYSFYVRPIIFERRKETSFCWNCLFCFGFYLTIFGLYFWYCYLLYCILPHGTVVYSIVLYCIYCYYFLITISVTLDLLRALFCYQLFTSVLVCVCPITLILLCSQSDVPMKSFMLYHRRTFYVSARQWD